MNGGRFYRANKVAAFCRLARMAERERWRIDEAAQFEKLQKNYIRAREPYEEILAKDTKSEYSHRASERLIALEGKE